MKVSNSLKTILVQVFLILSVIARAQERLVLKPLETDSVQLNLQRQMEYRQLISGQIAPEMNVEKLVLPQFSYKSEFLKRYSYHVDPYDFYDFPLHGFRTGMIDPYYSPFVRNGAVLSEGAYRLNDKFTFGGFSYGANSVMSAPFPNQGINKFDTYGSTLFMQYKVSKNFKIETRVNVQQRGTPPGF